MVVCLLKAHLRFRESFVNPLIAECARFFNSYEFSDRFYVQACANGYTGRAAEYFAQEAKLLGIVKRPKKPDGPSVLTQVSLALDPDLTSVSSC